MTILRSIKINPWLLIFPLWEIFQTFQQSECQHIVCVCYWNKYRHENVILISLMSCSDISILRKYTMVSSQVSWYISFCFIGKENVMQHNFYCAITTTTPFVHNCCNCCLINWAASRVLNYVFNFGNMPRFFLKKCSKQVNFFQWNENVILIMCARLPCVTPSLQRKWHLYAILQNDNFMFIKQNCRRL